MGFAEDADRAGLPASHERRGGAPVMGCLERRPVIELLTGHELPAQRAHRGDFEGLGVVERWEDPGQALSEEGLTRARSSAHEEVVTARGGDLEPEPSLLLPLHLGEVVEFGRMRSRSGSLDDRRQGGDGEAAAVGVDEFGQRGHREDIDVSDERGLRPVAGGDDESVEAGEQAAMEARQHAAHRSDAAVEAEFPTVDDRLGLGGADDPAGLEHGDGDAEIEAGADLRHTARGEVDRQMLGGDRDAEEGERRTQPLARFAHRGVGKADDVDAGKTCADDGFDRDDLSGQPPEGDGGGPPDDGLLRCRLATPRVLDSQWFVAVGAPVGVDSIAVIPWVIDDVQLFAHASTCTLRTWVTVGRGDMTMPIASMRVAG